MCRNDCRNQGVGCKNLCVVRTLRVEGVKKVSKPVVACTYTESVKNLQAQEYYERYEG